MVNNALGGLEPGWLVITFHTGEGVRFEINARDGIFLSGRDAKNNETDLKYGDLEYETVWERNNTLGHFAVRIENGPKFVVKAKLTRRVLSFGVTETHGISDKVGKNWNIFEF